MAREAKNVQIQAQSSSSVLSALYLLKEGLGTSFRHFDNHAWLFLSRKDNFTHDKASSKKSYFSADSRSYWILAMILHRTTILKVAYTDSFSVDQSSIQTRQLVEQRKVIFVLTFCGLLDLEAVFGGRDYGFFYFTL